MMGPVLGILAAYVLGATPTSHWVARAVHGVDLRREGSGNLGATNTFRALGPSAAVPVLLVDILKGWIPAYAFPLVDGSAAPTWALVYGGAAVLGHSFSFWVGFRGGKGVATATGLFLAVAPWALLVACIVWTGVVAATRLVSLASVLAALALALGVHWTPAGAAPGVPVLAAAVAVFVVWMHRRNLVRLVRGEEPRLGVPRGGTGP